jgi:hypothetical protein
LDHGNAPETEVVVGVQLIFLSCSHEDEGPHS